MNNTLYLIYKIDSLRKFGLYETILITIESIEENHTNLVFSYFDDGKSINYFKWIDCYDFSLRRCKNEK